MRGFRLGLLFAGTALAVVLAAPSMSAYAANAGDKVESLVPMPDTSPVPPPTAADVKAAPAADVKAAPAAMPATATPAAAPAPEPAAAAAPALNPLDQQVADKLREVLTGKA